MKTEETKKGNSVTPSPSKINRARATRVSGRKGMGSSDTCVEPMCDCEHPGLCNMLKHELKFRQEEADVLRKNLDVMTDSLYRAEASRDNIYDLLPTRAELRELYQSIKQSLADWENIGRHIQRIIDLAYDADESGGNVIRRVEEIAWWADTIIDQADKRPAALDMIEKYSDIVFGDSKYLLDNTDD